MAAPKARAKTPKLSRGAVAKGVARLLPLAENVVDFLKAYEEASPDGQERDVILEAAEWAAVWLAHEIRRYARRQPPRFEPMTSLPKRAPKPAKPRRPLSGSGYMPDRSPTGHHVARFALRDDDGVWRVALSGTERCERIPVPDDAPLFGTEAEALAAARRRWKR